MSERNAMAGLTRWVLAHKRLVLGLWLVVAIGGLAATKPAGDALSEQFNLPGTEAFIANHLTGAANGMTIVSHAVDVAGVDEISIVATRGGTVVSLSAAIDMSLNAWLVMRYMITSMPANRRPRPG